VQRGLVGCGAWGAAGRIERTGGELILRAGKTGGQEYVSERGGGRKLEGQGLRP